MCSTLKQPTVVYIIKYVKGAIECSIVGFNSLWSSANEVYGKASIHILIQPLCYSDLSSRFWRGYL